MPVLFTERTTPVRDSTATTAKVYLGPAAFDLTYAAKAYVQLRDLFGLPSLTGLPAKLYLWNTLGTECPGLLGLGDRFGHGEIEWIRWLSSESDPNCSKDRMVAALLLNLLLLPILLAFLLSSTN